MLLFSATFSNDVQMLAQSYLRTGYYFVRIGKMNKAVDLIRQNFIEVLYESLLRKYFLKYFR